MKRATYSQYILIHRITSCFKLKLTRKNKHQINHHVIVFSRFFSVLLLPKCQYFSLFRCCISFHIILSRTITVMILEFFDFCFFAVPVVVTFDFLWRRRQCTKWWQKIAQNRSQCSVCRDAYLTDKQTNDDSRL